MAAVPVEEPVKRYGDFEAVKGISVDVAPGETFGFLGPNGAGRSTTISMLCTLIKPTAGHVSSVGQDRVELGIVVAVTLGCVALSIAMFSRQD